jgi:hypothetical protein
MRAAQITRSAAVDEVRPEVGLPLLTAEVRAVATTQDKHTA